MLTSDDVTTSANDVTTKTKSSDVIIKIENGGKNFDHQNESGAAEPILRMLE